MVRKLNSFRKSFEDKRLRERLLSLCNGVEYTELPGFRHSLDHQDQETSGCCSSFRERFSELWKDWKRVSVKAMEMGRTDPRKIIFSAKMGLALILISLLIFFKEPAVKELGKYSVWAILTVVVVFEFSIGKYCTFFPLHLCLNVCLKDLNFNAKYHRRFVFILVVTESQYFNLNFPDRSRP